MTLSAALKSAKEDRRAARRDLVLATWDDNTDRSGPVPTSAAVLAVIAADRRTTIG